MSQFIGHIKKKITIPTKPILTGIKVWILADNGYFVHWFWHTKGDGPQGINKVPKSLGKNKIATVVLALLKTLPQAPPGTYNITLDNLFISIKFLVYLLA